MRNRLLSTLKEIMTKNILPALLIAFAVSANAQDASPSQQISNMSAEKAGQTKWEIQGSIGNKVVVVNGRGDTSLVDVGSEIDGCLVTAGKVICDTAEKRAIKSNDLEIKEVEVLRKKEGELQKQLAQLESGEKGSRSYCGPAREGQQRTHRYCREVKKRTGTEKQRGGH